MALHATARFLICVLALAFSAGAARAGVYVETDHARTEIVAESAAFAPGETTWFAVRQQVAPGWHVFWTNPGDAGLPLALDWRLPPGFEAGAILHPAPTYIPLGPLASYAHEGETIFLVPVTAPATVRPGETIDVEIDASWQVCEDTCVPEGAQFSLSMPVERQASPSADVAALFAAARAALPPPYEGKARIARRGAGYQLTLETWPQAKASDVFFFPEAEGLTAPAAKQKMKLKDGALGLVLEAGWAAPPDVGPIKGVLEYDTPAGARAAVAVVAEIDGALDAPAVAAGRASNVGVLLALAFFGGLILNAMPCVFPILFVKAAALAQAAHDDRAALRAHGLYYTAGVLATFILMAGLLFVLRAGGEELGWGFHLQSPIVVALSAYVLFLVGLNFAGVFSVGESLAGRGDSLTRRGGAVGAIFTGVLAVVVAAPCIGPLLSAPVGAALLQPPLIGMAIFIAMALGLAAPYLALSLTPSLGRRLPRPGPWMEWFRQALSFPVFGAAAYFLWVFSRQTGALGLLLAGAVLLAFAAWAFERSKGEGKAALILRIIAGLAVAAALAPLLHVEAKPATASAESGYGGLAAEPYDAAALAAYRAAGTPVFLDFTAAWCVTCQFNKMTVLSRGDVVRAFKETGTVLMVGDWTVRDPAITEALQSFGASGVPLYVFYPSQGDARQLPAALTAGAVIKAVKGEGG